MSKNISQQAKKISLSVFLLGIFVFVAIITLQFDDFKEFIGFSKNKGTPMTILDEPDLGASFENAKQTMVQIHIYTDLSGSVYSDASYTSDTDFNTSHTGNADYYTLDSNSQVVDPSITDPSIYGSFGSGCIWEYDENTILVATNYHVISQVVTKNALGYVVFYNGVISEFTVEAFDDDADCAFLSVDSSCMDEDELKQLRCVVPYDSQTTVLSAEEPMFVIHSKEIMRQDLVSGNTTGMIADTSYAGYIMEPSVYVSALLQDMLYCRCSADAGMSGGPTFDAYGHYIGMLTGATDQGETVSVLLSDVEEIYSQIQTGQ
ncbi:S1 family peptidase [Butyrivibrio fibrisolvens]|uniref:S1 family peptidase n=1 Tax=Butyrivibrio fibrisolvens TaxID=831 RepID=UPI0020BE3575|nr:serine protease [Butyrivibrio fibrisolvens]